jgi:hypothetical protein
MFTNIFHSHLLKAIQHLTTTVSHFVGRQTNNTPTAFKKEAKVNVKNLPSQFNKNRLQRLTGDTI